MARKSAEQRREEIVEIAFRHFAEGGYKGTSTETIAREAGISQPYLFRLFRTKRELFLACVDRCFGQVDAGLPGGGGGRRRRASGCMRWATPTQDRLLPDRHALLFQMQAYAIERARDPRARARGLPRSSCGRSPSWRASRCDATWEFFATGMMLNVVAMLDLGLDARCDE